MPDDGTRVSDRIAHASIIYFLVLLMTHARCQCEGRSSVIATWRATGELTLPIRVTANSLAQFSNGSTLSVSHSVELAIQVNVCASIAACFKTLPANVGVNEPEKAANAA